MHKFSISSTFLNASEMLTPRDSVAAMIVNEENHILLQLRDDKNTIFFPNHWGCFGGAIDAGESHMDSLLRELNEELGLNFTTTPITAFTTISFLPKPNAAPIHRFYYEVKVRKDAMQSIQLGEGHAFNFFTSTQALSLPNGTPYDKFAIWLYFNQQRLEIA